MQIKTKYNIGDVVYTMRGFSDIATWVITNVKIDVKAGTRYSCTSRDGDTLDMAESFLMSSRKQAYDEAIDQVTKTYEAQCKMLEEFLNG